MSGFTLDNPVAIPCSATSFYTYQPYGKDCYVIVDPNDYPLIGDQLPSTEAEAQLLCRVANLAHDHAVRTTLTGVGAAVQAFARTIHP